MSDIKFTTAGDYMKDGEDITPDYTDAPWSDEKEYTPEELEEKRLSLEAVLKMVATDLSEGILITQDMVEEEDGEYAHPELKDNIGKSIRFDDYLFYKMMAINFFPDMEFDVKDGRAVFPSGAEILIDYYGTEVFIDTTCNRLVTKFGPLHLVTYFHGDDDGVADTHFEDPMDVNGYVDFLWKQEEVEPDSLKEIIAGNAEMWIELTGRQPSKLMSLEDPLPQVH